MKPLFPVCVAVVSLAILWPAEAQERPINHPFYPLKVGNQWTYRSGKHTVVIRCDKEVPIDIGSDDKSGKSRAIGFALEITSGTHQVTEQVAVLADGVYRFHTAGKATKPPLRFFKFPLDKGDSWQVACKTEDGKTLAGSFVGGTETIELTINGKKEKLPTVTITSKDFHADDEPVAMTYWFARDYGMVKRHVRAGNNESTLELIEFKAAK